MRDLGRAPALCRLRRRLRPVAFAAEAGKLGVRVRATSKFLEANEGLRRRFPVTFDFPDFSVEELAQMASEHERLVEERRAEEQQKVASLGEEFQEMAEQKDALAKKREALAAERKELESSAAAEKEKLHALRLAQEEAMRKKGVVLQGDDLMRANKNRQMEEEGSATGLDNALNMLGMEEKEKSKNLKVLFNEFSERETPKVRADNPGLKLSQVKERVFRAWEKSPDNPKNQV